MNMRITLSVLLALLFIPVPSIGDTTTQQADNQQTICKQLIAQGADEKTIAKRGCCSWHKGVCGCSGGRVTCCDGTMSPSCTCNKETPLGEKSG